MKPNQAIFFDLGGTLLHPVSVGETYARIASRYGCTLPADVLKARFIKAFRAEEEADRQRGWITSETREADRWRSIVRSVCAGLTDFESCFAELYAFYAAPQGWTLDADAAALLTDLRGRRIALGVASNYDHRLFGLVRAIPELAPLEHLIVSAAVGWRKPAPAFFEAVQKAVSLPMERILMVGDDLASDYEGARACGMQAVLLDPAGRWSSRTDLRCIATLKELQVDPSPWIVVD